MLAQSLQSCMTLSDNMDYRLPGSSVHGIHQARILEWVSAGVQPQQDPGGTLRMKGVGERRHIRPALIGSSLRGRERESDQTGSAAGSGRVWQSFIFYHSFYTLG